MENYIYYDSTGIVMENPNALFFDSRIIPLFMKPPKNAQKTDCLMPYLRDFILSASRYDGIKTESEDPQFFSDIRKTFVGTDPTYSKTSEKIPLLEIQCTGRLKKICDCGLFHTPESRVVGTVPQLSIIVMNENPHFTDVDPSYGIYAVAKQKPLFKETLPQWSRFICLDHESNFLQAPVKDTFSFFLMLLVGRKAWTVISDRIDFLRSADTDSMILRFGGEYTNAGMPDSFYEFINKFATFPNGTRYPVCFLHDGDAIRLFYRSIDISEDFRERIEIDRSLLLKKCTDRETTCMKSALLANMKNRKLRDALRLSFAL